METLRLPAKIESLEKFRLFVLRNVEKENPSQDDILKVELVLEEIITNVSLYAYPEKEGDAEVACSWDGAGSFGVDITDWGDPFDPLSREDPDLSQELSQRSVGGLGIYLARQMADEMSYKRENGRNVLSVRFHLPGRAL